MIHKEMKKERAARHHLIKSFAVKQTLDHDSDTLVINNLSMHNFMKFHHSFVCSPNNNQHRRGKINFHSPKNQNNLGNFVTPKI